MKYYILNSQLYLIDDTGKTFALAKSKHPLGGMDTVSFNEAEIPAGAVELADAGPVLDMLAHLNSAIQSLIVKIENA